MAGNQGLGSPNMSQSKKEEIQRKGGETSQSSGSSSRSSKASGAAGHTKAAERGGRHSSPN